MKILLATLLLGISCLIDHSQQKTIDSLLLKLDKINDIKEEHSIAEKILRSRTVTLHCLKK